MVASSTVTGVVNSSNKGSKRQSDVGMLKAGPTVKGLLRSLTSCLASDGYESQQEESENAGTQGQGIVKEWKT